MKTQIIKRGLCHQKPHLRIGLILGSTRTEGPPYPAPLGKRIGKFLSSELSSRGHDVFVVDPSIEQLESLRKPHFAYRKADVPWPLDDLATKFANADAYVMCTPEYNHAPSPALLNILVKGDYTFMK